MKNKQILFLPKKFQFETFSAKKEFVFFINIQQNYVINHTTDICFCRKPKLELVLTFRKAGNLNIKRR